MIDGKRVLAIIPARGGSKGLPRKNIRPLLGKPLIAWTIEQAKESKYIDKIIVSSEDEEILYISKQYGAETIRRPDEYAKDTSPTSDAIIHAIQELENKNEYYDILILLEPTSPLRKKDDIDNALYQFILNIEKCQAIISVGEIHLENPLIAKTVENGYVKPFIESSQYIYQRQQYPKVYFPYGVVYISTVPNFKKYRNFYLEKTIPYFIERWQNYEIDDIYDFICVENILKYILSKKEL